MRALAALATSVAAVLATLSAVAAADLPGGVSMRYSAIGKRAAPLVIYQYEPGVSVRAYWLPPWRSRRYFPATGEMPEIGRAEDLSDRGEAPVPAENFERSWSTSAAFLRERLRRVRVLDDEPSIGDERLPPPDFTKPLK